MDSDMVTRLLSVSYINAHMLVDTGYAFSYLLVDLARNKNKEVGYLRGSIMMSVSLEDLLLPGHQ